MAAAPEPLLCCLSAPGALVDFSWLAAPAEASIARVPGIERLSESDLAALFRAANELEVSPDALAAIMSQESGFQPGIRNKKTGATGLIQFMPRTAEVMGTSTDALAGMTFQQQLPFVVKFYKAEKCKGLGAGGLYLCTFCPKLKQAPADVIIAHIDESAPGPCHPTASQSTVYAQNKILDVNKDGVPDVLASAPGRNEAYVYSGKDGAVLLTMKRSNAMEAFGRHVAGAGDVNGDGYPDLFIGSPGRPLNAPPTPGPGAPAGPPASI